MIAVTIPWSSMKEKDVTFSYADKHGNYYIFGADGSFEYTCVILRGSSDATDFEENYQDSATSLL